MRLPLALSLVCALLTCAAPTAAQPTASHVRAALEMLEGMEVPRTINASVDIMLNAQMQSNPEMRRFEGTLREFLLRHMSWESLRDEYAALYTARFTEAELRAITEFYRTPAGRKMVESQTELMREGAQLGMRRMQENQAELQALIIKEMGGDN